MLQNTRRDTDPQHLVRPHRRHRIHHPTRSLRLTLQALWFLTRETANFNIRVCFLLLFGQSRPVPKCSLAGGLRELRQYGCHRKTKRMGDQLRDNPSSIAYMELTRKDRHRRRICQRHPCEVCRYRDLQLDWRLSSLRRLFSRNCESLQDFRTLPKHHVCWEI